MVVERGPVVIDWHNATEGPPDLDVALSALILAQVAVHPTDPRAAIARTFLGEFLTHVRGDPVRLLDRVVVLRAADRNLTGAECAALPVAAELVRVTGRSLG